MSGIGLADATCPAGTIVTGGGFLISTTATSGVTVGSSSHGGINSWYVVADNQSSADVHLFAYAECFSLS
jgi:hypothetical protein